MNILDAEWSPAELHERERAAAEYSDRVYRIRRASSRRQTARIERLLAGSALFFVWVCVLALLLG